MSLCFKDEDDEEDKEDDDEVREPVSSSPTMALTTASNTTVITNTIRKPITDVFLRLIYFSAFANMGKLSEISNYLRLINTPPTYLEAVARTMPPSL